METSNEETLRTPASLEPVQIPTGDVEKQENQPRKESGAYQRLVAISLSEGHMVVPIL